MGSQALSFFMQTPSPVADFQVRYILTNLNDPSRRFVSQNHGFADDKGSDRSVSIEM